MYVFFSDFEKVKKCIFTCNFLKTGSIELKICAKKTCNRSGSSPKILSKSVDFSKIYNIFKLIHFVFDLTVLHADFWDNLCTACGLLGHTLYCMRTFGTLFVLPADFWDTPYLIFGDIPWSVWGTTHSRKFAILEGILRGFWGKGHQKNFRGFTLYGHTKKGQLTPSTTQT